MLATIRYVGLIFQGLLFKDIRIALRLDSRIHVPVLLLKLCGQSFDVELAHRARPTVEPSGGSSSRRCAQIEKERETFVNKSHYAYAKHHLYCQRTDADRRPTENVNFAV